MQTPSRTFRRRSRRFRLALVSAVLVIGFSLSLGAYLFNRQLRDAHLAAEFARSAEIRHALTREIVNHSVSAVYAVKSLFEGSDRVTRDEFTQVAGEIISRYSTVNALEWVPVVSHDERLAFEAKLTRELGRPFEITEAARQPDAPLVRAADRDEHYPILFVEPFAGNERAFGLDVKTAPTRASLELARERRELVATEQFLLVQGQRGISIVCPVFGPDDAGSPEARCIGFVQGVFRVDHLLDLTQLRSPANTTDTLFIDDTATDPAHRLLYYSAGDPAAEDEIVTEAEFRRGLHQQFTIEFGGRRWFGLYRPTTAWIAAQDSLHPELWFGAGLLITSLVAGLGSSMARRTAAIEGQVAERTAELEDSRRQLDNLLHALPGMAFRARYADHANVLFVSEGCLDLTGWSPIEFMNGTVHFRDVMHPEDVDRVRTATRLALDQRRDYEIEYRIVTRTAVEKWVLTRGRGVYSPEGQLQFFEGLAIDITARKQAEAEKLAIERKLLESQKLESLGLLAGGIAHDFNNLLTGILGNASLARHGADLDLQVANHLREIESAAGRAADLCQQMLAYSGRGRFLVESVDLGELVRDTLPLLKGSLSPRARLQLALSTHPTTIMADATQIRQIAMNLIINAGDALGPSGGDIIVTTARQSLDAAFLATARGGEPLPAGEYVTLEVRDNGCGMGTDTLARIFDPFFTTKFTGRGLGLAAVLGIVRGHGGALRVHSELGLGSTFTLVLPPGKEPQAPSRTAATSTPWQQRGKILVIDDEEPVREVAAQLIKTFGFSVVTAVDGADGIAQFSRDPSGFALVFLDLTMPGLDGEETLAALRAISPRVRVMLVSGYSENDRVANLATRGPLLFLQKPFTRARLEQKLREILS